MTHWAKNRCWEAKKYIYTYNNNKYNNFQNDVQMPSIHSKGPILNAGPFEWCKDSKIYLVWVN